MKILMVCLGNICRSPIAEGVLQHKARLAGLDWIVESAGTYGFRQNEPPHSSSIKVCKENGVDIHNQRARKLTVSDFDNYDLLLPMANDVMAGMQSIGRDLFSTQKSPLFLDALRPGLLQDVPDPYYGTYEDFEKVYNLIDECCDAIIKKYG